MKSPNLRSVRHRAGPLAAVAVFALAAAAVPSAVAFGSTGQNIHGHSWYVSASAQANGNGSQGRPFNSLASVESAAKPSDTIIVLPSPASTPPLNGGIALKPGQQLIGAGPSVLSATSSDPAPRLTNTTGASNSGDVVELADNTQVSNLVIDGSYRGGIYGDNVTGVNVHGNNVSGQNTSCTFGFLVLPFAPASDTVPPAGTVTALVSVQNGWAGIMIDGSQGHQTIAISNNYVHNGVCGDGIDVRTSGTAQATAQVSDNTVTQLSLPAGNVFSSVLGIGMQAADSSKLNASVTSNAETYIGSAGADCEGLFLNTNGSAVLNESVDRNTFEHGIGGKSCNGFEDIVSSGPSTINATVQNSTFQDNPGDMLQELNFGVGSSMSLNFDNTVVNKTTIALGNSNTNNIGECLWTAETGVGDSLKLAVNNSSFSGCNNGISALNNVVSPSSQAGAVKLYSIAVTNSQISNDAYDGLYINNVDPVLALANLSVKVQNSSLTDSSGAGAVFDQASTASTASANIDLGGGSLGSIGQNNIYGNDGAVQTDNYRVSAEHDWWGTPAGPASSDIALTGSGNVQYVPFLSNPAN
jgi:hypothetical protein